MCIRDSRWIGKVFWAGCPDAFTEGTLSAVINEDVNHHRPVFCRQRKCRIEGRFNVVVVFNGHVFTTDGMRKRHPVRFAELDHLCYLTGELSDLARYLSIVEQAVNDPELVLAGSERFHSRHHHRGVTHQADDCALWMGHFQCVGCGHTIPHGIEIAGTNKPTGLMNWQQFRSQKHVVAIVCYGVNS